MSRNGSGTYSLVAGNPVTTGTTISSTTHNNTMSDIASALTESIARDGQTTPTANLPMGGFKHTNVANATSRTEYCSAGQAQDNVFDWLTTISGVDTITANGPIALSAYAAGQCFRFVSAGANTGAVTININAIGAKSVTKFGTTALASGDIPSGSVVEITYDGTQFQIVGATCQPRDAELTAIAGLTSAADTVPYFTGSGTAALKTIGTASGNIPLVGTSSSTDTLAGLIELATAAEAQALTDTGRAITPSTLASAMGGANHSLAETGYQKFPGGLIIQWGVAIIGAETAQTVTLPLTFPNAFWNIQATIYGNFAVSGGTASAYGAITSNSQFTLVNDQYVGSPSTNVYWLAIGM